MTTMEIDEVLYTQLTFRQCLDVMARPGRLGSISLPPHAAKTENLSPYLVGLAMTLLDQEVTFHIDHGTPEEIAMIQLYTMSRLANESHCDYFFANGKQSFQISKLKKGDLVAPDQSCTILCCVRKMDSVSFQGLQTVRLALQGPGIEQESVFYVEGLCLETIHKWKKANDEFPLGVDWILVDEEGRICGVPRSSRMEWREM